MGTNQKRKKRIFKQAVIVAAVILIATASLGWFINRQSGEGLVSVRFENPQGGLTPFFQLEIARTNAQRQKGLMYVRTMPENRGMLFVFPEESARTFWMKNTYVSLDMIFLDHNLKVVGIEHNVPILNEDRRGVSSPSMYVIELTAGTAKKHGIVEGSAVKPERKIPVGI